MNVNHVRTFGILFYFAFVSCSIQAQNMKTLKSPRGKEILEDSNIDYQSFIPTLLGGISNDITSLAEQTLNSTVLDSFEIGNSCLNHTKILLQALVSREQWALRMLDAMGKPASGFMGGNLKWLGSYDECFAVEATVNNSGVITAPFTGRYCLTSFSVGKQEEGNEITRGPVTLMIGVCLPHSCNNEDTRALLKTLMSVLPLNMSVLPEPRVDCKTERFDFDTKAIFVIVVCSLFGLLMFSATIYDVIVVHWWKPRSAVMPQCEADQEKYAISSLKEKVKNYDSQETITSFKEYDPVVQKGKNSSISNGGPATGQKKTPCRTGKLGQILLSFSVYTNASKILNTDQPTGTLAAVNGIRFISMTWVIFGHNFGYTMGIASNMGTYAPKMFKRFTFQVIENATVSVDTFFTLSGLLVAYLCLKEMKKRGGVKQFKWGMFYFHRFWRLTPPYMLFLMFYVCLLKYFSNGPLWTAAGLDKDACKDTWWKNLLYVNNLVDTKNQCMGWGWYLANDMQFFVVSPLMLIPLYYSPSLGTLSCLAMMLINFISVGVIASRDHLNANLLQENAGAESTEDIYIKPWCRVGPYAAGFFTGYILYRTDCKIRIPQILNLAGWFTATTIGLLVVYGLYDSSGFTQFSNDINALYLATHRTAWATAVCWVIVACATGHGGFVNTLLSWKALIPLSRLTYCAYLTHLVVMQVYFMSKRSLVYLTDLEQTYFLCGNLVMSYAVAFIVSLTFEAPMMGLEKALLGRGKNS